MLPAGRLHDPHNARNLDVPRFNFTVNDRSMMLPFSPSFVLVPTGHHCHELTPLRTGLDWGLRCCSAPVIIYSSEGCGRQAQNARCRPKRRQRTYASAAEDDDAPLQ